jgi:H+/Cl- antiporter ClcA
VAKHESYIKNLLEHWQDFRLKLFFEGILTGAFAGLVVVCFRLLLAWMGTERPKVFAFLASRAFGWSALAFACVIGIALILSWLIKMVPMATGSGIPQVKGMLAGFLRIGWFKVIGAKFMGGLLGLGAGLSMGREGPSVQLGAAAGQGISRLLKRPALEEKYLLTSGASAGLAAAFNAPLAGVVFALEELHKNFSPVVLATAVAASVTADVVTRYAFGQSPVFSFHNIPLMPFHYYLYVVILGLLVGAFGVLFNSSLVNFQVYYEKIPLLPSSLRPAIPLVAAGFLGFVLPQALGGGAHLINSLPQMHYAVYILLIILVTKFLFTMMCYGTGVPGGIFMPLLAIGALSGNAFGDIAAQYLHVDPVYVSNFICLAMAAYFSAIVKAPITGCILILEMTGSFDQLLPLITVCMSAYVASDLLEGKPIYDVLLNGILAQQTPAHETVLHGHDEEKHILEKVVGLDAPVCASRVCDIAWPENSLLVGIRRGDAEMIPARDTVICPGDYLIVMSGAARLSHVHSSLQELTGEEKTGEIELEPSVATTGFADAAQAP